MKERLTIGKLAQASGVNVETVRFYERQGLIKQPPKGSSFRIYPESYIARIVFIKKAQELGFSLQEAKGLLMLGEEGPSNCVDYLAMSEAKIKQIEQKIADLHKMKRSLEALASCCDSKEECELIDCFLET